MKVTRDLSCSMEFRAASDGDSDGSRLVGYAATFDDVTHIRSWEGDFDEIISRGAFKKTLREQRKALPIMQWNHGRDTRVGEVPIGHYDVAEEDSKGLRVEGPLYDNPVVEPIRQAIAGGAVRGMSFKFEVIRDEWRDANGKVLKGTEMADLLWNPGDRGPLQRTLKEIRLFEMGPVSRPAYASTSVGLRQSEDLSEEERQEYLAERKKTIVEPASDSEYTEDEIREWLDAESEYRDNVNDWLEAESAEKARASETADLIVSKETTAAGAVRKDTSAAGSAESTKADSDAVRKDTSGTPKWLIRKQMKTFAERNNSAVSEERNTQ